MPSKEKRLPEIFMLKAESEEMKSFGEKVKYLKSLLPPLTYCIKEWPFFPFIIPGIKAIERFSSGSVNLKYQPSKKNYACSCHDINQG
ncbi:MAG: hypothetical protein ACI33K_03585 [Clostridiaceae bacterium]